VDIIDGHYGYVETQALALRQEATAQISEKEQRGDSSEKPR